MYENTFLSLEVLDKTKTFCFIKESNHSGSYGFFRFTGLLFWDTYLHIFQLIGFLFPWIRRNGGNISVFIKVSHHFIQGFPFLRICFAFFHLFLFILPLLCPFLFFFLLTKGFLRFPHNFLSFFIDL